MNVRFIVKKIFSAPHFAEIERNRIANIQYAIAVATLIGLCLELAFRFASGGLRLVMPIGSVSIIMALSILFIRRGMLQWSGNLLLWALLFFLTYMAVTNDGIHDTAVLGIPAILIGAGLILKKRHFFVFTSVSLIMIVALGYAEISGTLHNPYSSKTNYLDIADLTIIIGLTTVTVRLLSDGFIRSLLRSRSDEDELRKQAAQLKESEERFGTLFEGANDAIFILRHDSFVECNLMAVTMLGCALRSEIVGHSPWEFSPMYQPDGANSKEKALTIITDALQGTPQRFFWKHTRKDGTLFDTEVSLSRLEFRGERFIQAFVRDISQNKQMEKRVRQSEEYYQKLVETSPDAIIIADSDARLSFASRKAYEMFDVPESQSIVGMYMLQWIAPEEHEIVKSRMKDFFTGQLKSYAREYKLFKHDSTPFWCEVATSPLNDPNGRVSAILMVCRDVTERRKAAETLRESEERFSRLSDAAFEGIVISENGRVVDLNEQMGKMFGYERPEIIGMPVTHFVAPESLNLVQKNVASGVEVPYEHLALRKNGSTFSVEVHAKSIPYNGHSFRVTAIRDITERKQTEEFLRTSEQKYRTLFESANDAMFIFDPMSEIILEANWKACETYGFSQEEFVGLNLKSISMDAARGESVIRKTLETGSLRDFETTHLKKNGVKVNFLVNASVIDYKGAKAILSISRDITERKRADEVLRLQSAAIQSAANAIVITDRTGAITFVNSAFTRITGYLPEEAIGKNPKILKSGEQTSAFYTTMWQTINSGNVWQGEVINKRKDGSLYSEEMTITPVQNEQGEITHFIAIKNDITERKSLEEHFRQSQKMESIGTLAGGIAHDFNNILGIILGHSTLLERFKGEPQNLSRSIEAITKATQRGAGLVKQLLTFARKTDALFETVNINEMIGEINKLLTETFPKTITLSTSLQQNLPAINADAGQIHQVLLNLCVNARDAMPKGGTLSIATKTIDGDAVRSRFPKANDRHYVQIEITDTGMGMDDATRRRIFEPFFTTKDVGKGTGLGLAVVSGIVEHHGGNIDVRSVPGQGTMFIVYFPVPERAPEELKQARKSLVDITGGTETVLVIEDEEMLMNLVKTLLVSKGYTVLTAENGKEGVEKYLRHQDTIAVILSDIGLPILSGQDVLKKIRAKNPKAKVILASGFIDPEIKSEMYAAGAKHLIQKPYLPDEVLQKIREVIDDDGDRTQIE